MDQPSREAVHAAVDAYVAQVRELSQRGDTGELSYRPAQMALFGAFKGVRVIHEATASEGSKPDFTFLDATQTDLALGHGESKSPGTDLTKVEHTEQLRRYLAAYENLVLTNVTDFRFYHAGGAVASPVALAKFRDGVLTKAAPEQIDRFIDSFADFLARPPEKIGDATRLAAIMAGKARRIRQDAAELLGADGSVPGPARRVGGRKDPAAPLAEIWELARRTLDPSLDLKGFTDMYAQTLVYGLFAARFHDRSGEEFTRARARELVGAESAFLRAFFDHVAGPELPEDLRMSVDQLCRALGASDVHGIALGHMRREGEDVRDPIIHFYELFLDEYDPRQRRQRGVYYTPTPVVRYMLRKVDWILRERFGLPNGLADTRRDREGRHLVKVLDPALGTATFLNELIRMAHDAVGENTGLWPRYVEEDLLPRLFGFELMMAPYAIAHLKIQMTLSELGYDGPLDGIGIHLANALEPPADEQLDVFGVGVTGAFAREAAAASQVKRDTPIMVVVGNPPYSGHSANRSEYANSLVDPYYFEPLSGVPLRERNTKWLRDDYVKFIAFAEKLVLKNPVGGVVALVTNNGYLDNPTFRGMRYRLRQVFDKIHVIDLHGSARKHESAGSERDQNIFDIQVGVSILIAVRDGTKTPGTLAEVLHAEVLGSRAEKFAALDASALAPVDRAPNALRFHAIDPDHELVLFKPRRNAGLDRYLEGVSLEDLFRRHLIGLFTGRDKLTIARSREELIERLEAFKSMTTEEARSAFRLGPDVRDWSVGGAQSDLRNGYTRGRYTPIAYRPFDTRWTYYTGNSRGLFYRPRDKVMRELRDSPDNIALVVGRQGAAVGGEWTLATVARHVVDLNIFHRGGGRVFPMLVRGPEGHWESNLDGRVAGRFALNLASRPPDAAIVSYVYGVLQDPAYRARNAEFLKSDLPVIPIPASQQDFDRHAAFGSRIMLLDLLEADDVVSMRSWKSALVGAGPTAVERRLRDGERLWINQTQHFTDVSSQMWEHTVGGYQVLDKWLKDRMGAELSAEECETFLKVLTAVRSVVEEREAFAAGH
jgi:hypothetical protein